MSIHKNLNTYIKIYIKIAKNTNITINIILNNKHNCINF